MHSKVFFWRTEESDHFFWRWIRFFSFKNIVKMTRGMGAINATAAGITEIKNFLCLTRTYFFVFSSHQLVYPMTKIFVSPVTMSALGWVYTTWIIKIAMPVFWIPVSIEIARTFSRGWRSSQAAKKPAQYPSQGSAKPAITT